MEYLNQYPYLVPAVAVIIAELMKIIISSIKERKVNWLDFFKTGGMPSGHSTMVSSLSTMIYLKEGASSFLFAASSTFAFIVVFDAVKLRAEAGKHAAQLNKISGQKALNERLGHTVAEVTAGVLLGIVLTLLLFSP
jgi:acid phosphatase family membrane protein YuiD